MTGHDRALKLAQSVQELMFRLHQNTADNAFTKETLLVEAIDTMDSLFNILHGLREEEKEIARFEGSFRETGLDDIDEIDAEEEEERLEAYEREREEKAIEYERNFREL